MRILITGCSKGLGRATAQELTRRGHHVIATARDVTTLADLPVAQRLALDITDDASVRAAIAEAGVIDVLVNNAAEYFLAPLESAPLAEVRRLYDINVFGTLRVIQAVAPAMRARGAGTIVTLSSVVGRAGFPLSGAYSSTKWALEGLSETLRLELGHFGVHVVLVEPGAIGTGALDAPRAYFAEPNPYAGLVADSPKFERSTLTPPAVVARTVADAAEHPERQFRWPVGDDAVALIGARARLDDVAFAGVLRSALKLTW